MFKSINKIFIVSVALATMQPAFSMEIYAVKSNDYLYKIAKNHSIKGISTSEMTDAIKGINKSEVPGIVDNRIKIGDKLAIPTTKDEVEDGLTLTRNQMIKGSYNQSTDESASDDSTDDKKSADNKLGDNSMASSKANKNTDTSSTPSVISQDKVPALVPGDDSAPQTYKNNLTTQIDSSDVQETASDGDDQGSSSFLWSLFKLVFYIVVLAGIALVGKRFWESRNTKKEQELELISKKKRDHLMSRISPVVSDNDFYKSENSADNDGPQEEFDFFGNNINLQPQRPVTEVEPHNSEHESHENDSYSSNSTQEDLRDGRDKNFVVKTEKGVVFETSTDETSVEEVDTQHQEEQELQYINELVEQFLESEKYVEASITIQDSLEKDPNNIDLRYKLLEVYAQAGDEIAFEGEVHFIKSKNIVSMFDPLHQKIAKLRDKYFE